MYIIPYMGIFVKWSCYDKSCINLYHPCRHRVYFLTKRGETLIPAIIELNKWGMNYLKEENIPCAYKGDID